MKKVLKILLIAFGCIVLLWVVLYITNNTINLKKSKLDLVKECDVDLSTTKIYEHLNMGDNVNTPVTFFFQDNGPDVEVLRKHYLNEYNIELPEFDFNFDDHSIAISIGRKIVDIKYYKHTLDPSGFTSAHITFDSRYSEGQMYIYQIDKIYLVDEILDDNYYYIMNDGKREFIGYRMPFNN